MLSSEINVKAKLTPYFCWWDRTSFTKSKKTTDVQLEKKTYFLIWAALTPLLRNYTAITRLLQLKQWHLCRIPTSGHPLKVSSHLSAIAKRIPQLQYVHEYKCFRPIAFECIEFCRQTKFCERQWSNGQLWPLEKISAQYIRDLFAKTYQLF